MKKVVLAYSGGLDTSVAIRWLKDRGYAVIAYMADVGQEKTTRAAIGRAKKAGATKVVVRDLKKRLSDYCPDGLQSYCFHHRTERRRGLRGNGKNTCLNKT